MRRGRNIRVGVRRRPPVAAEAAHARPLVVVLCHAVGLGESGAAGIERGVTRVRRGEGGGLVEVGRVVRACAVGAMHIWLEQVRGCWRGSLRGGHVGEEGGISERSV